MQHKTILVTGGTGFVGSHLVEELIKQGDRVITTYQSLDPRSYFSTQSLADKVVMTPVDIVNFNRLFGIITKWEVNFIYHLAAQPLVDAAYYHPTRTLDTNIRGTINVLESARRYPYIKGVVFASSDKAYGKMARYQSAPGKYVESDPLQGNHPYEVSKSAADLIVNSYFKTYAVPVVTTRFGNIYGEGDLNFSRIIPGIMASVIDNTPLDIRSDGTFVRDYLYVKDVVRGYLLLAQHLDTVVGQAFNFGSNDTLSVLDLIAQIEKVLGKKVQKNILNQAKNEIPYQSLNFDKIQSAIGWEPKYSIQSTAQGIYQWYSQKRN